MVSFHVQASLSRSPTPYGSSFNVHRCTLYIGAHDENAEMQLGGALTMCIIFASVFLETSGRNVRPYVYAKLREIREVSNAVTRHDFHVDRTLCLLAFRSFQTI